MSNGPDRKMQQLRLIMEYGALVAGLAHLASDYDSHSPTDRAQVCGRFALDLGKFHETVSSFCRDDAGGAHYEIEEEEVLSAVFTFSRELRELRECADALRTAIDTLTVAVLQTVAAIPATVPSHRIAAGSPFQAYRILHAMFATAKAEVILCDKYVDRTVFDCYLGVVPGTVPITLITSKKCLDEACIAVSALFAKQRGQAGYCLVHHKNPHDRLILIDGIVHQVGGSLKDAAKAANFAVSYHGDDKTKVSEMRGDVASGTQLFGPQAPKHPNPGSL